MNKARDRVAAFSDVLNNKSVCFLFDLNRFVNFFCFHKIKLGGMYGTSKFSFYIRVMYSSIQKKIGHCIDCPPEAPAKPLVAGRCAAYHYKLHQAKKSLAKRRDKFMLDDDALARQKELAIWFSQKMLSPRICENCGADLVGYSKDDWFSSQHHILEKAHYPSVATHPLNHLVLCGWDCHPQVTNIPSSITKMKCFPKAKRLVQLMLDSVASEEKRRIPEYFLD